jgi:hypothetical protein
MSKEIRKMINKVENVNNDIESGIDFLFNQYPILNDIGTKEQYNKYLDTVFPNSKVKKILYHRTPQEFKKFKKSKIKDSNAKRFYFSPFDTGRYGKNLKLVILNIENLAIPYDDAFIKDLINRHPEYIANKSEHFYLPAQIYVNADKYGFDGVYAYEGTNDDEYSVYEPNQIHILGTKKDMESFKKFVKTNIF